MITKQTDKVMKKVSVFYTKKNYSPFDYFASGKITKRNYDEDGEFEGFEFLEPSLDMYEKVSENEFIGHSNEKLLNWVVKSHNAGEYPKKITEQIRNGELNVGFSSFSTGCVVKIDGSVESKYYISNGFGFDEITEEFSKEKAVK